MKAAKRLFPMAMVMAAMMLLIVSCSGHTKNSFFVTYGGLEILKTPIYGEEILIVKTNLGVFLHSPDSNTAKLKEFLAKLKPGDEIHMLYQELWELPNLRQFEILFINSKQGTFGKRETGWVD